jgi:thiol:disulfide interchange protein DsbD
MFTLLISSSILLCLNLFAFEPTISWHTPNKEASIYFTMPVEKDDALYKEYIAFSSDQNDLSIIDWTTNEDPIIVYDPIYKDNKKIYTKDVTFKIDIALRAPVQETTLRYTYYLKNNGSLQEALLHIPIMKQESIETAVRTAVDVETIAIKENEHEATQVVPSIKYEPSVSWSCTVSNLIEHTQSLWLQCLLIFLLGAMLSLTPCIYPMIPITVGILQGQGSSSFWRNLFLSSCYSIGVATTFALFGITAAYTGKLFGSFMQNPFVIIMIVLLLLYLAGSMFGFYEMYIPRMFNGHSRFTKGGSPLTAFLFGAVSGTVASPCVSPGLALVLSIVAGLANPFIGFIFLFAFGIGLSLPLFIIGTFSGSLNLLPKAGIWMVEIKKIFGFLLLGMAIYFLSIIIPSFMAHLAQSLLLFGMGIYYLYASKKHSLMAKLLYNMLGIILIVSSMIAGYMAIRATLNREACDAHSGLWSNDYNCALEKAKNENRHLFIKVEAPCCSMCTAIEKKFFYRPEITGILKERYITVRIDGTDSTDRSQELLKQFKVMGFPTILIVNPHDDTIVKRWATDLYDYSVEQFADVLRNN